LVSKLIVVNDFEIKNSINWKKIIQLQIVVEKNLVLQKFLYRFIYIKTQASCSLKWKWLNGTNNFRQEMAQLEHETKTYNSKYNSKEIKHSS